MFFLLLNDFSDITSEKMNKGWPKNIFQFPPQNFSFPERRQFSQGFDQNPQRMYSTGSPPQTGMNEERPLVYDTLGIPYSPHNTQKPCERGLVSEEMLFKNTLIMGRKLRINTLWVIGYSLALLWLPFPLSLIGSYFITGISRFTVLHFTVLQILCFHQHGSKTLYQQKDYDLLYRNTWFTVVIWNGARNITEVCLN